MESEGEEKNRDEVSHGETPEAAVSESREEPSASGSDTASGLLPKALSVLLHHAPPAGHRADRPTSHSSASRASPPPNLEQLQSELTLLRGQFEQMNAQHNKEIKLLMNELDEEKKIRLTLQMEIKRIKKHLSK